MTQKQKEVLIGMILGDAYLQKTGSNNSRLRLEHGALQEEYLGWKVNIFKNYFHTKIQFLERYNPVWKKHIIMFGSNQLQVQNSEKCKRFFIKNLKK